MFPRYPAPDGSLFPRPLGIIKTYGATASFALLSLILMTSTASAQTQGKRAAARSEERVRRVADQEQAGESVRRDNAPKRESVAEIDQPSLVRKTALTYSSRPGNQAAERPALVNDIVIISRAEETPARKLGTLKAGAPNTIPSIWPVHGTLRSGVGIRSNPFGGSSLEYHKGQDIAAPSGTPVIATADGNVIIAGWLKGYGNVVYIDHGNGISTRYGHLSRIDVALGQPIKRGEQLGLVGSTGRSTGPHLHYEVRIDGQPTSPLKYLPQTQPPPPPAR
jgi:murein DD-endopeptidase MepM/ murein hydrolase activator NlpD